MTLLILSSQPTVTFISLLACLFFTLPCPCIGEDYYVKPSTESGCPSGDSQHCRTLDEYANNAQYLSGDVTFLFIAGVHHLTNELALTDITSFQFRPVSDSRDNKVIIQLFCSGVKFKSISQGVSIERLTISSNGENSQSLVLINSPATLQQLHIVGVSVLVNADTGTNLIAINININININITESNIEKSKGTGLLVVASRSTGALNLWIKDSNISHHLQGGVVIDSSSELLHVDINGSVIDSNIITCSSLVSAAGLSVYSTRSNSAEITIQNSRFINNQDLRGHPVIVYVSRAIIINITNCEFRDNRGTAIKAENIDYFLRFHGHVTFQRNSAQQGGALALVFTQVGLFPGAQIKFEDNHADDVGGAIYVESTSALYEANDPNTNVECFYQFPSLLDQPVRYSVMFINNTATNGGDHIYGASVMSYCIVYANIPYSGDIKRSNDDLIQRYFRFDEQTVSPVSSNPSRVCIIDEANHNQPSSKCCANKSQIFNTHTAFPGEEFQLNVILAGAEFGAATGAVYAHFLPQVNSNTKTGHLRPSYQNVQRISLEHQMLNYSVQSTNPYEVLVLSATAGTILAYGDEDQIVEAIKTYKHSNIIPSLLLTTPIYINVTLSECPSGFYLHPSSLGCECNPVLCNAHITSKLSNGTGLIYLGVSVWVDAYSNVDSNVSGIILHRNCPFDYCNVNSSDGIDLSDADTQCAMNHAGVLCGGCRTSFSLSIGSNNCLACHNSNGLSLLIFFAAAGFLLVFFIKFLNLTVSQGTINGLIFYANVIWMYRDIFFPNSDVVHYKFFYVFLAWINLDFGIETCFVNGLTAFWKTWLQFLFPLYIWSIAGGIIVVARCSKRMTKLFGNNSVPVLATLLLLSYAKLLRAVITVLYPANLYVYKNNGEPVKSLTAVVWALDGNLLYGGIPHIFLLLVVIVIVIPFLWAPYTFCLLFIRSLRRHSDYRCFRWVNRLKPFFDAYVGSLNPSNHHWVGLLLFVRFILLFVFTLTYADNPFASLLCLVIINVFLLMVLSYTGRLYDNPTTFNSRFLPESVSFRSILEVSFLFNLAVVSVFAAAFYLRENTTSKEIFIFISVVIAFIQFVGIVVFHVFTILKNLVRKTSSFYTEEYQNLEEDRDIATAPTTSIIDNVMGTKSNSSAQREYLRASYESARYREPILTELTN